MIKKSKLKLLLFNLPKKLKILIIHSFLHKPWIT